MLPLTSALQRLTLLLTECGRHPECTRTSIIRYTAWYGNLYFYEQAIPDGVPAYRIAIDLSKAFDNVPIDIVFAVCKKMGMNDGLWRAMRGMYDAFQRRFKMGSEAFKDTNGILQGCPLSVMLLNGLMAVLSSRRELC